MQKTFYIKSFMPALIVYNEQEFLIENIYQFKTIVCDDNALLKVYPISNNDQICLPYIVKLDPKSHNQNLLITQYPDNKFECIIKPKCYPTMYQKSETKNQTYNGHSLKCILYSGLPSHIVIFGETKPFVYDTNFFIQNLQTKVLGNYLVLQAECAEQTYVLILDQQLSIVEEKLFDDLQINDLLLKGYLNQRDMAKHGIIAELDFSKNPYAYNTQAVYINNKPNIIKNDMLVPYAFLEALQINNYKLANQYLSQELSTKLKVEHLKSFFGDFVDICQNRYCDNDCQIALIYPVKHGNMAKLFKFDIKNNKINNIFQP